MKKEQMISIAYEQYLRLKEMAAKEKRSMRSMLTILMDAYDGK